MPAWVAHTKREGGEIGYYIGQVKVAKISLKRTGEKWGGVVWFSYGEIRPKEYSSIKACLAAINEALSSPPKD